MSFLHYSCLGVYCDILSILSLSAVIFFAFIFSLECFFLVHPESRDNRIMLRVFFSLIRPLKCDEIIIFHQTSAYHFGCVHVHYTCTVLLENTQCMAMAFLVWQKWFEQTANIVPSILFGKIILMHPLKTDHQN